MTVSPSHSILGPPRWGALATVAWSIAILVIWSVAQTVVAVATLIARGGNMADPAGLEKQMRALQFDGNVVAYATLLGMALGVALVLAVIKLKRGARIASYIDLRAPSAAGVGKWALIFLAFLIATALLETVLQRPVPEFITGILASAHPQWLLWLAVAFAAPVFEEVLFRGFLFSGLQNSRVGVPGAVLISAACFAVIHLQYEWFEIAEVFCIGVLLAMSRHATRSLWTSILLHSAWNLTMLLAVAMQWDYLV